ncbi:hypothetical protein ACFYKX_10670 [Cytobacillus sp. FJAT-54145]|uniref:Uncharacterized protein n=1 Tax=Cytobacillus spartinae TaxID=3299023 RepID=A0ABW6KDT3_9BACI
MSDKRTAEWLLGLGVLLLLASVGFLLFLKETPKQTDTAQFPVETIQGSGVCGVKEQIPFTKETAHPALLDYDWQSNGKDRNYLVRAYKGTVQAGKGVVLSDENCLPDKEGLSHCLNEIRVSKETFTVLMTHNLKESRCLNQGETVHITLLEDDYAMLTISKKK